ncbi:MAG: general secretion pathway protein GspK [Candidatus Omnitrophica bacterium]|nr:general secretion pathway protein GspK [Candidatus Omnitrophota bacterium]
MNNIHNFNEHKKYLLSNQSGIILITTLWVIFIILIIALGLSRKTSVDLAFGKFVFSKVQADYAAQSGIVYALHEIRKDTEDEESTKIDTHFACGVVLKQEQGLESVWDKIAVGNDAKFSVLYNEKNGSSVQKFLGLSDEERKIDINTLRPQDVGVLTFLLTLQGVDEAQARIAAASIIDWKDPDEEVTESPSGAETEYYKTQGYSYLCKNTPFDSVGELKLVRGVTPQIFQKLKNYVTVFPKDGRFQINVNTAGSLVIKAVLMSVVGVSTNTEEADADSLVQKIVEQRNGDDGIWHTADDQVVDEKNISMNAKEKTLFYFLMQYHTPVSRYLRITSEGVAGSRGVTTKITAIVDREDFSTVYWKRE